MTRLVSLWLICFSGNSPAGHIKPYCQSTKPAPCYLVNSSALDIVIGFDSLLVDRVISTLKVIVDMSHSKRITRGQYMKLFMESIDDAVECFDAGFFTISQVNDEMGGYYLNKAQYQEPVEEDYDE